MQKLGRGAYGIVWKAIDKKTREAGSGGTLWWDVKIAMAPHGPGAGRCVEEVL